MAALCNRASHYIFVCGFFVFLLMVGLWNVFILTSVLLVPKPIPDPYPKIFLGELKSTFFFFFISSPNLSRRRLDVCHTCTHGVALVRI